MECPVCEGQMSHLGILGVLVHWECQDCGLHYHTPVDPMDKDVPFGDTVDEIDDGEYI